MSNKNAHKWERRALQMTVGILGLIPVGAGLSGALFGLSMIDGTTADVSVDSHFRYLSGLLLGTGIGFWSSIRAIERHRLLFLILTLIVFVGGLSRLAGMLLVGMPSLPMIGGLVMELIVTPLLCLWQARVARLSLK